MNEKTEKRVAGQMLDLKEHGYSVRYILRKSAIAWLSLFALLAVCVALNHRGFLAGDGLIVVTGLVVGAIARDIGWLRRSKRLWSLYVRVIDWAKVKEIAGKETANHTPDGIRQPVAGSPKPSV